MDKTKLLRISKVLFFDKAYSQHIKQYVMFAFLICIVALLKIWLISQGSWEANSYIIWLSGVVALFCIMIMFYFFTKFNVVFTFSAIPVCLYLYLDYGWLVQIGVLMVALSSIAYVLIGLILKNDKTSNGSL